MSIFVFQQLETAGWTAAAMEGGVALPIGIVFVMISGCYALLLTYVVEGKRGIIFR